jgi:hypothetical protein
VTLYWAYGSNLNIQHMRSRCPTATVMGRLTLDNTVLRFRQVADVAYLRGATTQGGIWKINDEDVRVLDQYEGVDLHHPQQGLYQKRWLTLLVDGNEKPCLYYQMNIGGIMPPSQQYLDVIAQGYRDFGLDLGKLEKALQHSWNRMQKTQYLLRRHKRKGMPELARGVSQ